MAHPKKFLNDEEGSEVIMTEVGSAGLDAPHSWIEEVADALLVSRDKLEAVVPMVAEIVHTVQDSPGDEDDAPLTAFLIGFAAAKDGDFSPEAVQARIKVVADILEGHK